MLFYSLWFDPGLEPTIYCIQGGMLTVTPGLEPKIYYIQGGHANLHTGT